MNIKEILDYMNPLEVIANYGIEQFDDIITSLSQLPPQEKADFIQSCQEQLSDLQMKWNLFQSKL